MGISLSGIGTVGKEQLISSCSNGEPNWLYIPTKGKSSKTHAEFVSEIKELAQYQLPDKAQKGLPVHLCWTGTPLKIQTSIPELLPPAERKPRRFQNKNLHIGS